MKTRQTDQMKFMNQQFAQLIKSNTAKSPNCNLDQQTNQAIHEQQE